MALLPMVNGALWNDVCAHDFALSPGKYLLVDAGFGTCDALLVPYHDVHELGDGPADAPESQRADNHSQGNPVD
ncbi:hypothetical protein BDR07DRAFT_1498616 [Suillus spraguei]|nr:hypothetical protein BDR07DRAFT_1498616 [Suillus spraguei]